MPEARRPVPEPSVAMSAPVVTIEITKDYLHFSAAHFTIFGPGRRENLHGHNFDVGCYVDTRVGADGLCFDYNVVKSKLERLCNELDERMIVPERSPHISLERDAEYLIVRFGDERIPFLTRDVLVLPIRNATIEEFAAYFVGRLAGDPEIERLPIDAITIRIASGPGQWASCKWERSCNS